MKKTTVALSLALAITGGAAWAGKYTLVTPNTPHLQQGWSSANPQDVNRVDATGGVAFLTITVDKQSPGPSPISMMELKSIALEPTCLFVLEAPISAPWKKVSTLLGPMMVKNPIMAQLEWLKLTKQIPPKGPL